MRKIFISLILGASIVMVGQEPSTAKSAENAADSQFRVLNPWAEVDPIAVRGISPRVDTLAGKKVGLFANFKRAARPISAAIENRLKAQYPDIQTSLFDSRLPNVTDWLRQLHGTMTQSIFTEPARCY